MRRQTRPTTPVLIGYGCILNSKERLLEEGEKMSTLEQTGTGGPKLLNPATAETNAAFQGFGVQERGPD